MDEKEIEKVLKEAHKAIDKVKKDKDATGKASFSFEWPKDNPSFEISNLGDIPKPDPVEIPPFPEEIKISNLGDIPKPEATKFPESIGIKKPAWLPMLFVPLRPIKELLEDIKDKIQPVKLPSKDSEAIPVKITNHQSPVMFGGGGISVPRVRSTSNPGQDAIPVANPDGSNISGGGGGGSGDASAAKQDQQTALLTTIDTDTGNIATSAASIDTKTPALGQALAAASTPVVLPAAQITTLTPPAAITNYANETGGNLAGAATSLAIIDDWDETDRAKVNPIAGQAGVQGGSGAVSNTTQRVVLATDVALPAGTNAIGKLAANNGVDIGDVDVTSISAGTNLIGDVGIQPRTTNGLDTFMASGSDGSSILVATKQTIKASAGKLYGYYIYNPETTVIFVHFYNTDTVTVGTTNPKLTLPIPAGSAANLGITDMGVTFDTAISCAATTTAGGNTAPSTGISLVAWYK